MISKLLTLLSTAKGAAAAGAIVAAAATTGVAATNQDVQNAVTTTVQNITQANASPAAQPAVVASRNLADQRLRSAFQDDQQKLEKLHSTKVTTAITDMDKIVSDTATAISTLATVDPGKPADAGQPADAGKPADVTGGKPATLPTPPARPTP